MRAAESPVNADNGSNIKISIRICLDNTLVKGLECAGPVSHVAG